LKEGIAVIDHATSLSVPCDRVIARRMLDRYRSLGHACDTLTGMVDAKRVQVELSATLRLQCAPVVRQ
jgi:hypothetical protein